MKVISKDDRFGLTEGKEYNVLEVVLNEESQYYLMYNDNNEKVHLFQNHFYVSEL